MVERSDKELAEFSRRLLHSVQLYFCLSRTLTRIRLGFEAEPAWETSSAQVESFAMHTRGLADFFYVFKRKRGRAFDDDAFAFDFYESPEKWRDIVGEPGPWLRRVRFKPEKGSPEEQVDRFGKQIAHLNYDIPPVSDFARGWPVMQISNEVGSALARFTLAVNGRKLARGFKTKVWREIPAAAKLNDPMLLPPVWTRPSLRLPPL
jgi:hypothetical protein